MVGNSFAGLSKHWKIHDLDSGGNGAGPAAATGSRTVQDVIRELPGPREDPAVRGEREARAVKDQFVLPAHELQ